MTGFGDVQQPIERKVSVTRRRMSQAMFETILRGRTQQVRKWLSLSMLAVALPALAACEGDNLFSGSASDAQPRAFVVGPSFVQASDTFQVRVDAFAPFGVSRVDISLRGAVTADTSFRGDDISPSASPIFKFKAPDFLADSLIIVTARVTDKFGNVSRLQVDTINAFGAPAVISVTKPDSVRAGQSATVRVRLVGSRRITQVNVQVRGAMTLDQSFPISPPSFDVTQDIVLQVPPVVLDTVLRISVSARDEAGVESEPTLIIVPIAGELPTVTLNVPTTAQPGGSLDMSVRAVSTRGVASIRVELRGATTTYLDTVVVVNPPRTDVTQLISLRIPASVQDSLLTVRVFAVDTRNTPGPAQTATVRAATGVPVILSLTAPLPPQPGQRFDVRLVARGSRLLSRIDFRFRGAFDSDQSFAVNPPRTDVTQDAFVDIPLVVKDTFISVLATATDASGAVSDISVIRFSVPDQTPPGVTVTVTPGSAAAGNSVTIQVLATDNVGVASMGYEVRNASGTLLGTATVAGSGRSGSANFTFTIPAGTPAGALSVIGFATDGGGRRGQGSTTLTVL
jgi:hypothetical protein